MQNAVGPNVAAGDRVKKIRKKVLPMARQIVWLLIQEIEVKDLRRVTI